MLRRDAKSFRDLREYLDTVPVIETHDHYTGLFEPVTDVLEFVTGNYYHSDYHSAAFGDERKALSLWSGSTLTFDQKYDLFEPIWRRSDKTAYARSVLVGLAECWGVKEITRDSLRALGERFRERDAAFYERMMAKYRIRAKIVDLFDLHPYVEGSKPYSKYCRFAFPLPGHHDLHTKGDLQRLAPHLERTITSLDDYLEAFEAWFRTCLDFGIVCLKDQTAYRRAISYACPPRADAERVFNRMVSSPRERFGEEEVRPLDDWLFHQYLRLARRHGLPVQIHTGHMAGIRNDIAKTNAVLLTPLLELYEDVRFDLFHGNWPYLGEYLFLGKNYPNVTLDLCWLHAIDPLYAVELMKRAVMTVPHAKVLAFGADTGAIEWAVAYLVGARDNVAYALSELVDDGWIDMAEARAIAHAWFFDNPNEVFRLGLTA